MKTYEIGIYNNNDEWVSSYYFECETLNEAFEEAKKHNHATICDRGYFVSEFAGKLD